MTDTGDVLSMRIRPLNYLCRDPIGAAIQTSDVRLRPEVLAKSGLRNAPYANQAEYQNDCDKLVVAPFVSGAGIRSTILRLLFPSCGPTTQ